MKFVLTSIKLIRMTGSMLPRRRIPQRPIAWAICKGVLSQARIEPCFGGEARMERLKGIGIRMASTFKRESGKPDGWLRVVPEEQIQTAANISDGRATPQRGSGMNVAGIIKELQAPGSPGVKRSGVTTFSAIRLSRNIHTARRLRISRPGIPMRSGGYGMRGAGCSGAYRDSSLKRLQATATLPHKLGTRFFGLRHPRNSGQTQD